MRSAYIYSDELSTFKLSEGHPYDPRRIRVALDLARRYALLDEPGMEVISPTPVSLEDLALVHNPFFLELIRKASQGEFEIRMLEFGLGTEDCPVFRGLEDFIRLAVGATSTAARLVMEEGMDFAFNPIGGFHHAGPAMAEGFCYANDVALVARSYADRGRKVAVIDIDAHHGNGTQEIFYEDPRVLTVSFHESGLTLYPYGGDHAEIGEGPGRGFNVNVPMLMHSDDEIFLFLFHEIVPPIIRAFSPDLVIGVMGADGLNGDPLAHLRFTNNSYVEAGLLIHKLAPRWIALGAGGYALENTARAWTLLWAALHGLDRDDSVLTLGGGFLGNPHIGIAGIRDRAVRVTGPDKKAAIEAAEMVLEFIRENVFPIVGAR